MAAVATHLADTSSLARVRLPAVARLLVPMLQSGAVDGCGATDFEMLWATRTAREFDAVERELRQLEHFWIEPVDWQRAREVQRELWEDFDLIVAVTGQPTTWVVARGSVP